MKQLIECVPNFSEGNDLNIINQIADSIKSVEGIIDPLIIKNYITFLYLPLT